MKLKKTIQATKQVTIAFMIPLLLLSFASHSEESNISTLLSNGQLNAKSLAEKIFSSSTGFGTLSADVDITLLNRKGREKQARASLWSQEGETNKTLTVLRSPKLRKGVKLMTYNHLNAPDEQWVYFPISHKLKKLSAKNKQAKFMGSEFSYEDFTGWRLEDFEFSLENNPESDPAEPSSPIIVIKAVPSHIDSQYHHQLIYFDSALEQVIKIELYASTKELSKTLSISRYLAFGQEKLLPVEVNIVNAKSGKQTKVQWSNIKMGIAIDDAFMTQNNLREKI